MDGMWSGRSGALMAWIHSLASAGLPIVSGESCKYDPQGFRTVLPGGFGEMIGGLLSRKTVSYGSMGSDMRLHQTIQ